MIRRQFSTSSSISKFMHRIIESRYQPNPVRQEIIQNEHRLRKQNKKMNSFKRQSINAKYWIGTHNGVFYRIPKLPSNTSNSASTNTSRLSLPLIPKLYTPTSPPAKLPPIVGSGSTTSSSSSSKSAAASTEVCTQVTAQRKEFWDRFVQWLYDNYSTLILNFGSICTLFGFTRSDVLELRCLSVTGSICAIIYHIATPPLRIPPLIWSGTFAVVNGYKIYEIKQEREGSVQLTTEQEEIYSNFFMPHGVTPKQFEMIHARAQVLHVKKGTYLIRQSAPFDHVDLVVAGTTRASSLGRFLTAASTTPTAHEERVGGASGAWIGEMCVLERVWMKEQKKSSPPPKNLSQSQNTDNAVDIKQTASSFSDSGVFSQTSSVSISNEQSSSIPLKVESNNGNVQSQKKGESIQSTDERTAFLRKQSEKMPPDQQKSMACRSMYTIVAQDDCVVLRWQHADMESLMEKSTDMRAALTRAMTAAIVGKVINFTVSRSKVNQTWATWLGDWKYNAGAEINIEDDPKAITIPNENLPNYPIKSFR